MLSILVKRTYEIVPDGACRRAESDEKLLPADEHYDDPMNSSVRLETDFVPFKLATDVVLNGRAYAPGGSPAPWFRASLAVGEHRKEVLVVGDRVARYREGAPPLFTEPEPITEMELKYERSYGGTDIHSDPDVPCPYPRNPVGRGFAVECAPRSVDDLPLPNLEDPADLLTPDRLCPGNVAAWEEQPFPCGLGWFPRTWRPRAELAGVMPADREAEEELRSAFAELVPEEQREDYEKTRLPEMDFRFFNGASPGLAVPYLTGEESVVTENLAPEGLLRFRLPGERPRIGLDIGEGTEEPDVVLHTVTIRMEDREVDLVWRGAVGYPGPDWLPEMTRMEVTIR